MTPYQKGQEWARKGGLMTPPPWLNERQTAEWCRGWIDENSRR